MHVINATPQAQTQMPPQTGPNGGNARMAGSVPRYNTSAPRHDVQQARPASFADQLHTGSGRIQPNGEKHDGFGLDSIIDAVNPLQHLPVVGTIYREVTGDDLGPVARVAGGAIYGGAVGAAIGAGNAALEFETGEDIAGHAMAVLDGANAQPRTPDHTYTNTPESRVANAIARYGGPQDSVQQDRQTYSVANNVAGNEQTRPAHIRQSSYNG